MKGIEQQKNYKSKNKNSKQARHYSQYNKVLLYPIIFRPKSLFQVILTKCVRIYSCEYHHHHHHHGYCRKRKKMKQNYFIMLRACFHYE